MSTTEPYLAPLSHDKTQCFQYDPQSKQSSLQCKQLISPLPKKTHMSKSQMKIMFITFFNIKSILHFEFIPQGQPNSQPSLLCGNIEVVT
jgi:hypothetical protein